MEYGLDYLEELIFLHLSIYQTHIYRGSYFPLTNPFRMRTLVDLSSFSSSDYIATQLNHIELCQD